MVDGAHAPPPTPDNGGDPQPPRRPDGCRPGLPRPAELLAGTLVLSSQSQSLESNPVVWLCAQEPVRTFQKRPPSEKAKGSTGGPT